ncbi:hypothetical protein [Kitasatospora sp. CB02891]|uniref:hypothetical protein n=1 Tax=Kitasatospora sp. CB02891 TaxID=2020329 RepID=UPI000C27871C|nr:hypothetical protein [Kitasatospora sp. CB02891]PJN22431.1 hypothetical protein CG736_28380 [Kitasatospora sp. CB02891]
METDPRDAYIADLRGAIQRTIAALGFTAGQLAVDDPEQAERLLAAAGDLMAALERTMLPTT